MPPVLSWSPLYSLAKPLQRRARAAAPPLARVAVALNRRNTMSRTRQTSIFILLPALVLLAGLGTSLLSGRSSAQTTQPYTWRNAQIVGGGFVPGIIFNQTEPGLVYARTDIGGAYRQDPVTRR